MFHFRVSGISFFELTAFLFELAVFLCFTGNHMLELTLPLFLDAFRLLPAFVVFFTIYLPILLMGCLFLIFLDHIGKNRGRNWCLPRITDNKRRDHNLRNFGFVQIHRVGISSRKNKAWRSQEIPIGESSRPF